MTHNLTEFAVWFADSIHRPTETLDYTLTVGSTSNPLHNVWIDSPPTIVPLPLTARTYEYLPKKIETEYDDFFKKFWLNRDKPIMCDKGTLPKTNISEDAKGLKIESLIPFAVREDIKVVLDPVMNSVKIEVDAHQDKEEKKKSEEVHLKEISRTSFKRVFAIDTRFDMKKASAAFENAILTITIPYVEDSEKRTLEIK